MTQIHQYWSTYIGGNEQIANKIENSFKTGKKLMHGTENLANIPELVNLWILESNIQLSLC